MVFTIDFPDPLLGKEIPYLAQAFDRVYILPNVASGSNNLPENVEVVSIFKPVSMKQPLKLLYNNFWRAIRIYLFTILQPTNAGPYLKYHRSFLGHMFEELEKIHAIKKFILSNNLSDALFYDFWFVNSSLAMAELKREQVIKHAFSRAHGFDLYDERQFEKRVPFREYKAKWLDAIFTISKHGYEYLSAKLPAPLKSKVHLSYFGITSPFVSDASIPKERISTRYTLVSCARLIPLKRITLLAEVLKKSNLQIHWVHFGDGPDRKMVDAACKDMPANIKVSLVGDVENEKVLQFYSQQHVDLFISLSETEGLPVSMMEAQSAGIPILSISVNGIPEIVNETTGVLIKNIHASAETILVKLEQTLQNAVFDRSKIRAHFNANFNATNNIPNFIQELKIQAGVVENSAHYQQCVQCILDTKDDPSIYFDSSGICNYCTQYKKDAATLVKNGSEGEVLLRKTIEQIKKAGEGKAYDCILGISGGVDSTYLAYQAKKLGLRPLAVHFDNGWNSELAVKNIENIVNKLELPLHTLVVDWDEFKSLQLAFLKASVIDIELATDHAMLATLYTLALKHNIRYILSGHNVVTESVLPKNWYHDKRDHLHIQAINKLFGTRKLNTYPIMTSWLKLRSVWNRIESISLLNCMPYNKEEIKKFIATELEWRDYGGKHYESVFTRFYQGYLLRRKFGVDKRKAHLSNLICSRQLTRDQALAELATEPYSLELQKQDYDYFLKKLQLSVDEFETIMQQPVKRHNEYPVDVSIYERYKLLKIFRPVWLSFKALRQFLFPS